MYDVPRVTVSTFDSEKYINENYSPSSFCTFLRNFNPIPREKVMTIFPRSPVLSVIQESAKRPTSSDHIFENIARKALKFGPNVQRQFFSNGFFLRLLKRHRKKSYSENATMTCLEQRNPRIQSSDTKCYETSSKKIEKIDQRLRIQPLRGGNLLYIT